jgi:hypothetical protein
MFRGSHLALWLLSVTGEWPPEIDIIEKVGAPDKNGNSWWEASNVHGTWGAIEYNNGGQPYGSTMLFWWYTEADWEAWHEYSVEVDEDEVRWYRDGVLMRAQANTYQSKTWYLAITQECASDITGGPPEPINMTEVQVDTVQVARLETPDASWPPAWPAKPALGMFHGIGQPFGDWGNGKTAVQLYNEWLGRPANIVACWCNSSSSSGWKDFDGIAGGAGDADTTWSGQLNETNPNRALDPSYWPVTSPFIFPLGAVPYSHQNKQNSSGQWTRPGIWSEIARGDFDVYYNKLFRRLAYRCGQIGRDPRTVVIRWCWEANGNWYPHSVGPDKANWISAWRRVMGIMRSAVGSVLGAGKSFMIEFGPAGHLRFGNGASERLWNIYPGDDVVDICGLGIHDQVGITVQADWDKYLYYPATIAGTPFEGYIDWLDYGVSRGKWVGTSEIESNYVATPDGYFPKTNNMSVMWTTGFEPLRRRYLDKFLYCAYLYNGYTQSYLHAQPTWSDPYKQLYKPGGTGEP